MSEAFVILLGAAVMAGVLGLLVWNGERGRRPPPAPEPNRREMFEAKMNAAPPYPTREDVDWLRQIGATLGRLGCWRDEGFARRLADMLEPMIPHREEG